MHTRTPARPPPPDAPPSRAADRKPPVYLWFEPEWFDGVKGSFAYWTGDGASRPAAGASPGRASAPSGRRAARASGTRWARPPTRRRPTCHRDLVVPRAGKYRVWVRYVDHRKKTEPFTVAHRSRAASRRRAASSACKPVVPPNDEYQLYWGFSFGWGSFDADLPAGPARLDARHRQGRRGVAAGRCRPDHRRPRRTTPVGREKPPFAYLAGVRPAARRTAPRGAARRRAARRRRSRGPQVGGRDFSMWTGDRRRRRSGGRRRSSTTLTLYDVLFQFAPAGRHPRQVPQAVRRPEGRADHRRGRGLRAGLLPRAPRPTCRPGTPLRQVAGADEDAVLHHDQLRQRRRTPTRPARRPTRR